MPSIFWLPITQKMGFQHKLKNRFSLMIIGSFHSKLFPNTAKIRDRLVAKQPPFYYLILSCLVLTIILSLSQLIFFFRFYWRKAKQLCRRICKTWDDSPHRVFRPTTRCKPRRLGGLGGLIDKTNEDPVQTVSISPFISFAFICILLVIIPPKELSRRHTTTIDFGFN